MLSTSRHFLIEFFLKLFSQRIFVIYFIRIVLFTKRFGFLVSKDFNAAINVLLGGIEDHFMIDVSCVPVVSRKLV